jgi:hypothetical protein
MGLVEKTDQNPARPAARRIDFVNNNLIPAGLQAIDGSFHSTKFIVL